MLDDVFDTVTDRDSEIQCNEKDKKTTMPERIKWEHFY